MFITLFNLLFCRRKQNIYEICSEKILKGFKKLNPIENA